MVAGVLGRHLEGVINVIAIVLEQLELRLILEKLSERFTWVEIGWTLEDVGQNWELRFNRCLQG